jgi:hypothetical protein
MHYVLEVHENYPEGYNHHANWCNPSKCSNKRGCVLSPSKKLGCINKLFNTQSEAAMYYNSCFPSRKKIGEYRGYKSELHEDTNLFYVITNYNGQKLNYKPFELCAFLMDYECERS